MTWSMPPGVVQCRWLLQLQEGLLELCPGVWMSYWHGDGKGDGHEIVGTGSK